MPWWGYLIMWFGIGIGIIWILTVIASIHFAAKQGKRMDDDFRNFTNWRF
jgi:hypothetical protein